jgi:hypothetical protein
MKPPPPRPPAEAPPRAPFLENYAKLVAGQPVPDVTLQNVDGQAVKLSEAIKGKTAIFSINSGGGLYADGIAVYENLYRKYAGQGLTVVALSAYRPRRGLRSVAHRQRGQVHFSRVLRPRRARDPSPRSRSTT